MSLDNFAAGNDVHPEVFAEKNLRCSAATFA